MVNLCGSLAGVPRSQNMICSAPVPAGAPVSMTSTVSGASTIYTFGVGGKSAVVSLAGDGTLRRVR